MKQKITRIGILGAAGKMGREITRQISNRKDCKVGVAIEKKDSPFLGLDSGDLAGDTEMGHGILGPFILVLVKSFNSILG